MTFLPIVERELRVAARRPALYRARWFAAMGTVLVWLLLLWSDRGSSNTNLSRNLFVALGVLVLAFCLLAGIFLTADCLSEEKRDGTLGLLFLTDLRGYDVVLGKLMATSVHAAYALMALCPVLALPLLMGGVTAGEFWRVGAVLAATLFLSLVMGTFVSAVTREARHAMGGTCLGILLLAGALPAVWSLGDLVLVSKPSTALLWPSPVNAFLSALDSNYRRGHGVRDFWCSLATVGSLSLGLLALSASLLPRSWRDRTERGSGAGGMLRFGATTIARCWRHCPPTSNPYFWLASRALRRDIFSAILLALLILVWMCSLVMALLLSAQWPVTESFSISFFTAYGIHQLAKYLVAVEASRQLGEDRRSGALELLLVTPLAESQILAGQRQALQRHALALGAILVFINLCLCGVVLASPADLRFDADDQILFMELFVGGIVALFFDFHALQTVGMWTALRARKPHRAVLATLWRVMLLPWVVIFLWVFLSITGGVNPSRDELGVIFALWFALGIINDLIVSTQAQVRLGCGIRFWITASRSPEAPEPLPPVQPAIGKPAYQ